MKCVWNKKGGALKAQSNGMIIAGIEILLNKDELFCQKRVQKKKGEFYWVLRVLHTTPKNEISKRHLRTYAPHLVDRKPGGHDAMKISVMDRRLLPCHIKPH